MRGAAIRREGHDARSLSTKDASGCHGHGKDMQRLLVLKHTDLRGWQHWITPKELRILPNPEIAHREDVTRRKEHRSNIDRALIRMRGENIDRRNCPQHTIVPFSVLYFLRTLQTLSPTVIENEWST